MSIDYQNFKKDKKQKKEYIESLKAELKGYEVKKKKKKKKKKL